MLQLSNQAGQQQQQGAEQGNPQPATFQVNVVVLIQAAKIQFQINIDPEIPFVQFVEGVKEQIFAQRISDQYDEKIEYSLGPQLFRGDEPRTLNQLGFTNGCTLQVRLTLKGGE